MVIEAVRGISYQGDIAIDDVDIINGACGQIQPDTCDFDDPKICGFTQVVLVNLAFSCVRG